MKHVLIAGPALVLAVGTVAHARATATDVTASGFAFGPKSVNIPVGGTVHWTGGGGTHNVVFDDGSFRSGDPSATLDASRTFDTPGTYTYHCEVHQGLGMVGTVVVGDAGTPTPAPGPSVDTLSVLPRVRGGDVRGSFVAQPPGATVTVAVRARGRAAGAATTTAGSGATAFRVHLKRFARKALEQHGGLKVRVAVTAKAAGQRDTVATTKTVS